MERLVRVMDLKTGGGFRRFLDLPDLLPVLEPEARAWTWSMQRMPDTYFDEDSGIEPAHLAARIAEPRGHIMDFDGMWDFAHAVGQVVWGEFVAAESPDDLPRAEDSEPWVGEHVLAGLYAFDSTFWLVGGPGVVIDRVAATFERVEEIDPSQWIRDER